MIDSANDVEREVMGQAKRWYWMRVSSMLLAVCVVVHLATMIYAVHGGLSAAEILARTRGNTWVAAFYGVFVLACGLHVPLGLQAIAEEWLGLRPTAARVLTWFVAFALIGLGMRAIRGLFGA